MVISALVCATVAYGQNIIIPPDDGVRVLEWSPDYKFIAVGNPEDNITIFDSSAAQVATFVAGHDGVIELSWSPNGSLLASGGQNATIRVWDVSTWILVKEFEAFIDGVFELDWNSTGEYLAASGFDTFRVWNTKSWEPAIEPRSVTLLDLQWHPENPNLFAFVGHWFIGITAFEDGELTSIPYMEIPPEFLRLSDLDWNKNGSLLAAVDEGHIYLWNTQDGKLAASIAIPDTLLLRINFVSDTGDQAVAVAQDGEIYRVDFTTGQAELVTQVDATLLAMAWNPETRTLSIGGLPPETDSLDSEGEKSFFMQIDAEALDLTTP